VLLFALAAAGGRRAVVPALVFALGGVVVALLLVRVLRLATSPPPQVLGRADRRPAPGAPAQD
jgi:hypothetical protein